MNRRDFLTSMGKGATGLCLASAGLGCSSHNKKGQNIILVTMDTTRKDHLGCYGYELPTSPNLDAFARESMVFEDCYSTAENTLPNHASILTGLHVHNHGVSGSPKRRLHPEITTLADILSGHGCSTVAITSVAFMNENTIGNGFQEFYSPQEIERAADKTTDVAIKVLDSLRSTDEAFFLWLHYWDPHYPYAAPNEYGEMFSKGEVSQERLEFIAKKLEWYKNKKDHKPQSPKDISSRMTLTEKDCKAMIAAYDEEIAYMDHHIGRLISALKNKGFYDNSIIILTADHGESLFENDSDWLGHLFMYEPVVRIPLIIRNRDIQPSRIEGLVQNTDLAPTLLNWIGLEAPQMDGRDMNALIFEGRNIREDILLTESAARVVGIVSGRYKMRVLTGRRQKPLSIPQSWKDEAEKLPRIKFDPQPPSLFDYDTTKGIMTFSWEYPSECNEKIHTFSREAVCEGTLGEHSVVAIEEVDGKTTTIMNSTLIIKRDWDREAAFSPIFFCRIVGKDRDGRNIASSGIVQCALKSPLAIERELYDLSTDPDEEHNIAKEEPEIVERLELRLGDFGRRNLRAIENGPEILKGERYGPAEMSEEDIERLKALGYV